MATDAKRARRLTWLQSPLSRADHYVPLYVSRCTRDRHNSSLSHCHSLPYPVRLHRALLPSPVLAPPSGSTAVPNRGERLAETGNHVEEDCNLPRELVSGRHGDRGLPGALPGPPPSGCTFGERVQMGASVMRSDGCDGWNRLSTRCAPLQSLCRAGPCAPAAGADPRARFVRSHFPRLAHPNQRRSAPPSRFLACRANGSSPPRPGRASWGLRWTRTPGALSSPSAGPS